MTTRDLEACDPNGFGNGRHRSLSLHDHVLMHLPSSSRIANHAKRSFSTTGRILSHYQTLGVPQDATKATIKVRSRYGIPGSGFTHFLHYISSSLVSTGFV